MSKAGPHRITNAVPALVFCMGSIVSPLKQEDEKAHLLIDDQLDRTMVRTVYLFIDNDILNKG